MAIFTHELEITSFVSDHSLHLALGYFDGLHLGHQAILDKAIASAKENDGVAGVLLLEPHPAKVLGNDPDLRILTPLDEKIRWIQTYCENKGEMHFFILPFDRDFAAVTPEAFAHDYLRNLFRVDTAVCGYNYQFGHQGAGSTKTLRLLAEKNDFYCKSVAQVSMGSAPISSTRIRSLIQEGAMFEAYAQSGHCHVYGGEVVRGLQIGVQMGFPTANIQLGEETVWPAYGVYACFVKDAQGRVHHGIVNAGVRPTVNSDNAVPSFEVYIMDSVKDLYGSRLEVVLTDRMRPEMPFIGLPALQKQISEDVAVAGQKLGTWAKLLRDKGLEPEGVFTCFIREFPI